MISRTTTWRTRRGRTWGRYRFAIEIARAMIEFGFTELGVQQIFGSTISARAKRLAIWFGATEITPGPGPVWMQERGWHQTAWQITYEAWERNAGVRIQ